MATFESSLKSRLIYIFAISDELHRGCLKIGETTLDEDSDQMLQPNSDALNRAARQRIDQYTRTAGIAYELLYTELTIYIKGGHALSFNDKQVHDVLRRSGIKQKPLNGATEWFLCDLETAKRAIRAVKDGRSSLNSSEITQGQSPIVFRPEQRDAIEKTKKQFRRGSQMLWNAKMRFGKTLSALQVVKEMEMQTTLILTHRPVVDEGWFEDFGKIFYDRDDYRYGSRSKGEKFAALTQWHAKGGKFVFFASMQDLRGSEQVGGKFNKNDAIFSTPWQLIIVDEAHEGTQTELGKAVMAELTKEQTKVLRLSGTPFNLFDDFKENEIFTWDYTMEQSAKMRWEQMHMGDHNPYAELPALNIYTYDLGRLMTEYADLDVAFNFREFFRAREDLTFVHEQDVKAFLDLLCHDDEESLYPYANDRFRRIFRHTLWVVPGVMAAKALSRLLKQHPTFGNFEIINVAGDGDEDAENDEALQMVNKAIGKDPEQTFTITLSCGRLTTGVTIRPWTAVFMLSGSLSTSAASYMQTIFRVQTPYTSGGKMKTSCYAFDFAPDRTLRVLAEAAKVAAKAGKTTDEDRRALGEFLNFCPVIAVEGSQMKPYDVPQLMAQLKRAQIEKVVQCGFEDGALYNDELLKLDNTDLNDFKALRGIIGRTKAMPKSGDVDINKQGLTNEEYEEAERLKEKNKRERTPEEEQRLQELKEKKKNRQDAISILRGISIRMPLLIYGSDVEEDITIDNFADMIDDASWEEFMPKDVTKEVFQRFKKYYEADVFREAARRIREMARAADRLTVEQRIERIANIFNTFRNPDKETVLTPWRVVNMHLSDCIGGYCFYDEQFEKPLEVPRYVDRGEPTREIFTTESQVLEINSKSGLYPLYVAYNIYRARVEAAKQKYGEVGIGFAKQIWDLTVEQNIFVVCKTPMAVSITRRTLVGYRDAKVNAKHFPDIINHIKQNPTLVVNTIRDGKHFWNINTQEFMKFNAVVGNPPYQVMDGGAGASAIPIYNRFVDIAKQIKPEYISLVMPARWYAGGRGLDEFRKSMLEDRHTLVLHDFIDGRALFRNVEIKGGVCYLLTSSKYTGKCTITTHFDDGTIIRTSRYLKEGNDDVFIRDPRLMSIKKKVFKTDIATFDIMVSSMKPYGLRGDFIKDPSKYKLPPIKEKPIKDGITIIGLDESLHRTKRYVTIDYPLPAKDGLKAYKIFVPRNIGSGKLQDNVFTPISAKPYEVCTETFVQIYPFKTQTQRDNCLKYMSTKFFRCMWGARKQDQSAGKDTYAFVPLQDFTAESDIDWSRPTAEIDAQLYDKYGLSTEEREFIERMIKPM